MTLKHDFRFKKKLILMKQKETLIICLHSTYIKDINFTTQLSIYLHNYLQFTVKYTILQYVTKKKHCINGNTKTRISLTFIKCSYEIFHKLSTNTSTSRKK